MDGRRARGTEADLARRPPDVYHPVRAGTGKAVPVPVRALPATNGCPEFSGGIT